MNIVLTGFMGTGKSVVGRQAASILHIPFYDIDQVIEKQEGQSVQAIFEKKGEPAFRKLETETLRKLSAKDDILISTGGGVLMTPENRDILNKKGILVCLTAPAGTILERLKNDKTRPLLAGDDRAQKIEALLKAREAMYGQCRFQIDTDGKSVAEIAGEVVEKVLPTWLPSL